MVIIGFLVCVVILAVLIIGVSKFFNNIDTNNKKKVVKNKRKEENLEEKKMMKKIIKMVVSWLLSKIVVVKRVEARVAGFRAVVPVTNTGITVVVGILENLNIPFEMELFTFATCKRIFKLNVDNKIHKIMKKLKFQIKALKKANLKKEKRIIKKNIKMLKKAIEKLNKHYKRIQIINNIMWFVEIIGNEKGGTMLPAIIQNIILKRDSKVVSMNPEKQDKKYPEKIRYVIIFHPYIENDTIYHSIDIVDVNKLKIEVDKVEGAADWLDEFYHKLPTVNDINNKPYMKYLYDASEYGVKILDDTIKYSSEDEYNVKINKNGIVNIKTMSKGKLIALALSKATKITGNTCFPALELGPQKVIFYSKKNEIENILKDINLYDEYLKLGVPQKKMQRLHKIFAPLTKLPVAKVLTGKEYDKYEGIIFVSESYAKKAGLVEGAKMAFTLKSLVHIVPDYELLKDSVFYDVAIGDDENKWKLPSEKLGSILHTFTNKIPSVNARVRKVMKLNENAMCNVNMTNNLSETDEELFTALKEIKKHHTNIDKIATEDKKSFLVKFEKILVDILGIEYFDTNNKDTSKIIYFNDRACEILNKVYKKYTETGVKDGKLYHKEYVRLETGSNEVKLDHNLIKKLGRCVAKYIKKAVSTAKWIGASGTVFPMELKPTDAYPLSWNVTKTEKLEKYINKKIETLLNKLVNYQIYFTKEEYMKKMDIIYSEIAKLTIELSEAKAYVNKQNAKLKALGISEDMMYVQRHPSVLGVWTELYYSPSTKLFYVDTQLWKTFFGGDFDGDTFTSFYPYHMLHKDMNILEQKTVDQKIPVRIIDPIDNPKMTYLIDKDVMHTYLVQLPAVLNNKIEENKKNKEIFTEEKKSVNNLYIDWANAYDAQQIVGKLHALVCSTLSFFTKLKLTTKEELEYATYFILKYVQPAIAGLKHEDIASLPILEELIEEMKEIYMKMFPNKDTAQFMYIIEDLVKAHQLIYNKVRRFNTIANRNYKIEDCDGDVTYYNDDLYYNYKNLKEITRMTTTYWTKLYNKLINAAKLYEPVMIDTKKPTPPTPNNNIKTSMKAVEKIEVKKTNISITPVNTTGKENKMIKMTPVLSVPEQKTDMNYDVDILGQYWLPGFKKNTNVTIEENINLPITESDSMEDMINKYYEAINNVIPKILEKVNFYLSEGYEYKYITKVIMVPEEISILIKQCKNNIGYVYDSDCFAVSLDKLIIDLTVNHHIDVVSNQTHLPTKEFDVKTTSFNELDDDLQNFIYDDVNHISVLNINPKLYTKELCTYYGSKFIFKTKKKYYAGIGSRQTPADVLSLMEKIAKHLSSKGMILRSGHAEGADQAFERGCYFTAGKKEIFIANDAKNDKAALDLAASIHPAWDKCSEYAKLLHARNGYIILGKDLKTPVDFVICYQDESKKFGGTRQGIKLAQLKGIKVYNLWKPNVRKAFEERLVSLNK